MLSEAGCQFGNGEECERLALKDVNIEMVKTLLTEKINALHSEVKTV
jgi:hypothetical protein